MACHPCRHPVCHMQTLGWLLTAPSCLSSWGTGPWDDVFLGWPRPASPGQGSTASSRLGGQPPGKGGNSNSIFAISASWGTFACCPRTPGLTFRGFLPRVALEPGILLYLGDSAVFETPGNLHQKQTNKKTALSGVGGSLGNY